MSEVQQVRSVDLQHGPELDALVAERVMGWHKTEHTFMNWMTPEGDRSYLKHFSREWSAMELVVEKMRQEGWLVSIDAVDCVGAWACCLSRPCSFVRMEGHTLPHAVCLAALKAKGVK